MTPTDLRQRAIHDYDILVIDPPWPSKKGGIRSTRPNQGRTLDYKTLTIPQLNLLLQEQILPKANQVHCVFLWGIDKFLMQGEQLFFDLGYRLHCRMIWNKTNGVAPAFTVRFTHEYISWFYKPSLIKVAREQRGKIPTVITEKAREHSRKPDSFYTIIDKWYPQESKIDIFSREKRNGWDQWGDETSYF